MRVLIAGATGYIGRNICYKLEEKGIDFAILFRDSTELAKSNINTTKTYKIGSSNQFQELQIAFEDFTPNYVINASGFSSRTQKTLDYPSLIQSNIEFGSNLAIVSSHSGAQFLNLSSFWQETNSDISTIKNFYSKTKEILDSIIDYLVEFHGLSATSLILYDNYGPFDPRGKVVSKLLESYKVGQKFKLDNPAARINLLHISDVVDGIIACLMMGKLPRKLEISNSEIVTVGHLFLVANAIVSQQLDSGMLGESEAASAEAPHTQRAPWPDNWFPRISLQNGLKQLIVLEGKI
jgi:nucleoside-diphosphate-sugar epimerase